jgi:HAE1 family hydrophobic/amphiphilic exporter-1
LFDWELSTSIPEILITACSISVVISPETLSTYEVTPNTISSALQSNNITLPAGSITVGDTEYTLSVGNQFTDIESVRNQVIVLNNQPVTIGEIADVYYRSVPTDRLAYAKLETDRRFPAIELSIYKSNNATITDAANQANQIIDEFLTSYPDIRSIQIIDLSEDIDQQFADLTNNFQSTILLVFIILFVFLGLRQATVASLSIPLTFLSAFIIMSLMGVTVNFLSLFSLLLALGLVVDDAIVIVQASNQYGKKFPADQAALLVFRDFVVPIWTTTLTTVWAFLPLLIAGGIIGAFIRSIPIVVSATLISSTAIAVLLNIPLTVIFARINEWPKRVRIMLALLGMVLLTTLIYTLAQGSPLTPLALLAFIGLAVLCWLARDQLLKQSKLLNRKLQTRVPRVKKLIKAAQDRQILSQGIVRFGPIANRYRDFLENTVENKVRRRLVYFGTTVFVVISVLFLATGLLKNEFFPATDSNNLYVNVEGPVGWTVERTDTILQEVENLVIQTPEVASIITQTGGSYDPFGAGAAGPHTGYLSVTLVDDSDRKRSSNQIAQELRGQVSTITAADVTVTELSGGPPAGAAFQVNIKGDDLETLEHISSDFMSIVSDIDGTVNVDTTLKQSAGEIEVNLIPRAVAERNLSAAQIGGFLRSALSGTEATSINLEDGDQDISIIFQDKDTPIEQIQSLVIPGPQGTNYTLSEVATFTLDTSPQSIIREDAERVVRVISGTTDDTSSTQVLAQFQEAMESYDMPSGYTWDVGGENEENQQSINSIIQAMGISVILILVTMVLQLESFRKAALVLTVIPLAVAGVFFNFTIFGIPLSFPALIGILALFGIVVNNSIMLVEKINQNVNFGFKLKEAISDACSSRFEPILLTSLTTSAGLLPITISDPLWRGLGGAIIAGLSVSGILILLLLPTLYYEVYKNER